MAIGIALIVCVLCYVPVEMAKLARHEYYPKYGKERFKKELNELFDKLNGKKVNDPQQFLCDYVNREFGLKGYVTQVMTY